MKYFIFMLTFCNIYVIIIKSKIVYENFNELKSRGELDMRKKILAIALATTMAFSTAVVAVPANKNVAVAEAAEETGAQTFDGWWEGHTYGDEITETEKTVKFKAITDNDPTAINNWDTPVFVVYYGDENKVNGAGYDESFVMRSDLYGWSGAANTGDLAAFGAAGFTFTTENAPADENAWAKWLSANKKGVDISYTTSIKDGVVTVKITNNGITSTTTFKYDESKGKKLYISVTGEKCTIGKFPKSLITKACKDPFASSKSNSSSSSKKKSMSVKKVTAKVGTKVVKGSVSVAKAKVKVTVGKDKAKTAKVSGKNFTLKVSSKLKKNTKITVKVTKSGYKTVTKTVKVK